MRRIKEIRLSPARGLIANSDITVSEIAARIGYGRVQEFSRDFHRLFGVPPTTARRLADLYKEVGDYRPPVRPDVSSPGVADARLPIRFSGRRVTYPGGDRV
jgi:AraC-like DNA-binding protein